MSKPSRPKCDPWLAVARQVIRGEFDKGSRSLLQSVMVGLRKNKHDEEVEAVARLLKLLKLK
jgi:hypothetical protein